MFTPIGNKELLSKKIATEIEQAIVSKKLEVGEKLPSEFELCNQFGVSRTAVREALQMLSAKGLISIEKGRGIFVTQVSSKNITEPMHSYLRHRIGKAYVLEIIEARQVIEPGIARTAALHRTDEDIVRMKEDVELFKKVEGSPEDLARVDMNFHLDIARATQNRLLPLMLKPVFRLMPEIKSRIIHDVPEARDSAVIWHAKILDAIIAKNPEEAHNLMHEHLEIAAEHAREMLKVEGIPEE